jgi:hypothetical protein
MVKKNLKMKLPLDFLNNKTVQTVLIISLVVYTSILVPTLNKTVIKLLTNGFVQVLIIIAIVLTARKNFMAALLLAVAYAVTLQTARMHNLIENMTNEEVKAKTIVKSKARSLDQQFNNDMEDLFGDNVMKVEQENADLFELVTTNPKSNKITLGLVNKSGKIDTVIQVNGQDTSFDNINNVVNQDTKNETSFKKLMELSNSGKLIELQTKYDKLIKNLRSEIQQSQQQNTEPITNEEQSVEMTEDVTMEGDSVENFTSHVYDSETDCINNKHSFIQKPLNDKCRGYSYFTNELNAQGLNSPVHGNSGLISGAPF